MTKRLFALLAACSLLAPSLVHAQQVEYYHLDGLGSVRAVTVEEGEVVERHDYLPFGEEWNPEPGGQPRKFTGKERDAETGWDYFGARYYEASLARFTEIDPVTTFEENRVDPQRWNRYAYVRNNPLRYVDPDGKILVHVAVVMAVALVLNNVTVANTTEGPTQDTIVPNSLLITAGYGLTTAGVRGLAREVAEEVTGVPTLSGGGRRGAGNTLRGGETRFTAAGRRAHAQEPLPPGFEREVRLPSGRRMDGYNVDRREVIEIKPDNRRAMRRGERQVERYCRECDDTFGPGHSGRVQTYDQEKYLKGEN